MPGRLELGQRLEPPQRVVARVAALADAQHALDRLGGEAVQLLAEGGVAARVDDRVEVAVGAERGRELRAAAFVDPDGPQRWGLEGVKLAGA